MGMSVLNVPSYNDWVWSSGIPKSSIMNFTRDFLLFLQQRSGMDTSRQRWLLKDNTYLPMLDQVRDAFPGAYFIHTHRKPDECVASVSNVFAKLRGVSSDNVDLGAIGNTMVEFQEL